MRTKSVSEMKINKNPAIIKNGGKNKMLYTQDSPKMAEYNPGRLLAF